jgi:hypothetical protein
MAILGIFRLIAAGLFLAFVTDASLGSWAERARFRHFRKLERAGRFRARLYGRGM